MNTTTLGLAKMQSQKLEAGRTYFVGASSSPKLALILAIDDHQVTMVNLHGETMQSYKCERKSTENLAARGGKTWADMADKARRSGNEGYAEAVAGRAALHGAPAKPRDFDVYTVSLRPVSGKWDDNANWLAAEEYGNTSGCIATELLDVTRVRGSELAKLMTDERFVVVKLELTEECARS